ncbi:large conductance mechanosensitive channel protein MscL [Candidatus Phytoplasma sacchari]|uniref:Large conductance mechanosensitive channel protein MscL n=1 Tax=Candidatus Phytoplasma sacchari TaxID=2609813 RepID=A0ABY7M4T5_9MOLU|nr:large conductance mechanosensitive channel protein MscL [Candidatus Phytoplasma sacchari]KAB8122307.1 large conductance mechanosensitive channel protein MscL [Candidatus Phytoplasma sacchari]WBL31558.1 large conductance mechanosensitive channel protein MscL [Candidatus Phytoplasma sacchari]
MKLDLNRVKTFKDGFKNFISKGDVLKLSVAFIMGQLFTKVVSSLSTDIIMPPLSFIFNKTDNLKELKFKLNSSVYINYGVFLQNVFEFLVVSFCLYIILVFVFRKTGNSQNSQSNVNKNLELLEKQQIDLLKEIKEVLIKNKENINIK